MSDPSGTAEAGLTDREAPTPVDGPASADGPIPVDGPASVDGLAPAPVDGLVSVDGLASVDGAAPVERPSIDSMVPVDELPAGEVVLDVMVRARAPWSHVVAAGQTLRIIDVGGNQPVDCLIHDAVDPVERYSAPDTLAAQGNIYFVPGTTLLSNEGRPMMTVTGSAVACHDTIGGACSKESNALRYGSHTSAQHACVENFVHELGRHGMGKRAAAGFDPDDPWSRAAPPGATTPVRRVGIPGNDVLEKWCDRPVAEAFAALDLGALGYDVRIVGLDDYFDAGDLLYAGAFVAERHAAVGASSRPTPTRSIRVWPASSPPPGACRRRRWRPTRSGWPSSAGGPCRCGTGSTRSSCRPRRRTRRSTRSPPTRSA